METIEVLRLHASEAESLDFRAGAVRSPLPTNIPTGCSLIANRVLSYRFQSSLILHASICMFPPANHDVDWR